MIKLFTRKIAEILNGKLIGNADVAVETVSTDTRQTIKNGLFIALKGEKFDAHHYLQNAVEQGSVAVVVDHECEINVPQIVVSDTRLALGRLGAWLKAEIKPKTVAMTGSSGKTTVKEMTASILKFTAKDPNAVLFTAGNLNNDIGVPLTLLRLTEQHKFAVIELGANHLGEIDYTTRLVQPDVALINNIAAAHLEGFGSLHGVAQAKSEIYRGLKENGIAVINADALYFPEYQDAEIGNKVQCVFSRFSENVDFFATNIQLKAQYSYFKLHTPQGDIEINLPYLGEHNISNALAAAALAMNVGASLLDVKQGLEVRSQVKGRLFPIQINENLLLLDDTYNANVDSLKSAIAVLQQHDGFRILVVGDMAELGDNSQLCHQEVANFAAQAKLDLVLSFGEESAVISQQSLQGKHFNDKLALNMYLNQVIAQQLAQQPVVVLAKGSRRMRMEDVIESVKGKFIC